MWYVYFLQLGNGDIYVGSTNDLRLRLRSHRRGQVSSAKAHLPIALKSFVAVLTGKMRGNSNDISNPVRVRHLPTRDFGSDIDVEALAMTG